MLGLVEAGSKVLERTDLELGSVPLELFGLSIELYGVTAVILRNCKGSGPGAHRIPDKGARTYIHCVAVDVYY